MIFSVSVLVRHSEIKCCNIGCREALSFSFLLQLYIVLTHQVCTCMIIRVIGPFEHDAHVQSCIGISGSFCSSIMILVSTAESCGVVDL